MARGVRPQEAEWAAGVTRRFREVGDINAVAAAVGRDRNTVRYHLIRAGLWKPRKFAAKTTFGAAADRRIREEYPDAGADEMGRRLGCPARAVRQRAYILGVKCKVAARLAGDALARRHATLRYDLFDTWTPESAWLLGYIWADGSIHTEGGKPAGIDFKCTATDADLLELVKQATGASCAIRPLPEKEWVQAHGKYVGRRYRSKPAVAMSITSTVLAAKLVDIHGIPPRKSFCDPPFPANVPDGWLHLFALGNLDGDGHVSVSEKRRRAVVTWLGSPRFIREMANRIGHNSGVSPPNFNQQSETLLRASWSAKADVLRLTGWLYSGATIHLARKRMAFEAADAVLESVRGYSRRRRADGTVVTFAANTKTPGNPGV